MSKFLKAIVNIFLVAAILVAAAILVPPLVGIKTTIIDTESIDTNLPMGSVTYSKDIYSAELKAGDKFLRESGTQIYSYIYQSGDPSTGTVTAVNANDPTAQPAEVTIRSLVSRVALTVPYIGYVIVAMHSMEGIIIVGLVILLMIILFILSELWKPDDDDEDDEDDYEEPDPEHLQRQMDRESIKDMHQEAATGASVSEIMKRKAEEDHNSAASLQGGTPETEAASSDTKEIKPDDPKTADEITDMSRTQEVPVSVTTAEAEQDLQPGTDGTAAEAGEDPADPTEETAAIEPESAAELNQGKTAPDAAMEEASAEVPELIVEEPVSEPETELQPSLEDADQDTQPEAEEIVLEIPDAVEDIAENNDAAQGSTEQEAAVENAGERDIPEELLISIPELESEEAAAAAAKEQEIVLPKDEVKTDDITGTQAPIADVPAQDPEPVAPVQAETVPDDAAAPMETMNGPETDENSIPLKEDEFIPVERPSIEELLAEAEQAGEKAKVIRDTASGVTLIDYSELL